MKKRILTMHFSNKNNPDLPSSFSLSVKKTKAVLSISGKEIKSEFNWDI
jgi:phosphoribosyl 1,2-cyclic phosphodiesterase